MTGRVLAVLLREWAELRRNRVVLLSVVLPPLLFAQAGGALYLGPGLVLAASLVAALADVALLLVAARLFQRETILTRWR